MTIKHKKQTLLPDDPRYEVSADEWNDDHVVTGDLIPDLTGRLLGSDEKKWDGSKLINLPSLFVLELEPNAWYRNLYSVSPQMLTSQAIIGNRIWATQFPVPLKSRWDSIAISVGVAQGGGAKTYLGIYKSNGNAYPGSLVINAGYVNSDSVGIKTISIDVTLDIGLYFLAWNSNTVGSGSMSRYGQQVLPANIGLNAISDYGFNCWYKGQPAEPDPFPDPFPAGGSKEVFNWAMGLRFKELG